MSATYKGRGMVHLTGREAQAWDGLPPQPDVTDYHWLHRRAAADEHPPVPAAWNPSARTWDVLWQHETMTPADASLLYTYVGVALTPGEVDAKVDEDSGAMWAREKALLEALGALGFGTNSDAGLTLAGVLHDLRRLGRCDDVSLRPLERVQAQLARCFRSIPVAPSRRRTIHAHDREANLIAMLREAASRFREYELHHLAKPDREKAERNGEIARRIEALAAACLRALSLDMPE